jgi:molybdate transport system ATP-binding protein
MSGFDVDLRHDYPGFALDVRFQAGAGITALFGRSGSGKTTVVNAIVGLMRPREGRITVAGEQVQDAAKGLWLPAHKRRIGTVFQDARLFPHLTVGQNLDYGRWFARGRQGGASRAQIVDLLGIGHLLDRRPALLSGGEKSRVALGRAILSRPRALLMDEPLAALDEARKAEILPYLERMRDELALPVLYISHSLAEVARLADTVVLIEAGRIIGSGPAQQVLSDPNLAPGLGLRDAGAFLTVPVAAHDADGLTRFDHAAGPIWLPQVDAPIGAVLRLRILAQDVILSRKRPEGLSALNILPGRIIGILSGVGPGVMLRLALAGEEVLLARVTRRSVDRLDLVPGDEVFAVLKSVSVGRENIGREGMRSTVAGPAA